MWGAYLTPVTDQIVKGENKKFFICVGKMADHLSGTRLHHFGDSIPPVGKTATVAIGATGLLTSKCFTMSQKRSLNYEAVNNIFKGKSKYAVIDEKHIGTRTNFTVQNFQDIVVTDKDNNVVMSAVDPTQPLKKRIFNLYAVSSVAMRNPIILGKLKAGQVSEASGDTEAATEAYNEFINSVSVNVGVLHPLTKDLESVTKGDQIKGTIVMLTPEANGVKGNLLTLDAKLISAVPIAKLEGSAFSLAEMLSSIGSPIEDTPHS